MFTPTPIAAGVVPVELARVNHEVDVTAVMLAWVVLVTEMDCTARDVPPICAAKPKREELQRNG